MDEIDREEHLAWCKRRALEYWATGDLVNAVASMGSDLSKHPETQCNDYLMMLAVLHVKNNDRDGVRRWIEGFH
jgi:hypothetical protein